MSNYPYKNRNHLLRDFELTQDRYNRLTHKLDMLDNLASALSDAGNVFTDSYDERCALESTIAREQLETEASIECTLNAISNFRVQNGVRDEELDTDDYAHHFFLVNGGAQLEALS